MLNIDKLISFFIIAILISLAGLVTIGILEPSWSPFQEGLGDINQEGSRDINNVSVEDAIIGLMNIESLRYKGDFLAMSSYDSYILEDGEQRLVEMIEFGISSNFNGKLDNSNEGEDADIFFNANFSFIEDIEERSAVIEIKFTGGDTYFKVNSSNDFLFDDYQEMIGNEWMMIKKEFFTEQTNIMSLGTFALLKNPFKSIKDIATILDGKKLFIIKEYLGIDKVAGENSEHYSVSIDKEVFKIIVQEYISLYLNEIASMIGFSPEDALDELTELFNGVIDGLWNAIKGIDLEVWLSQQGLLTKIKFDRKFTREELDDGKFLGMDGDIFNVNLEIEFFDFNKKIKIEIPENYINIDELMTSTQNRRINSARDARIISVIAQSRTIMTYLNANYGSYDNFNCEQADMVALCDEVVASGSEIKITKDKKLDSRVACVYSKLNQKENYWYCADSTGSAGFTSVDPGGTGYCVNGVSTACPPIGRQ